MWTSKGSAARGPAPQGRRGSALLTVLWLCAALSAIAFSLASTVRGEAERTSTAIDSTRGYYVATGAIQRAILYMLWGSPYTIPGAPPRYYAPGTSLLNLSFPSGDATVEFIPESAKFNVNSTPPQDLFRLLLNLGVNPEQARVITTAIVDWRTPAPGGQFSPFDQYYLSLAPSFQARHASLEEIEELLLVRGMTPDIFYGTYDSVQAPDGTVRLVPRGGLADCLSVFGSSGQFDINSAAPAVLLTLGVPPDLVSAIVQRRRVQPFSPPEILGLVRAAGPAGARLRIGGNSIFTLRATARPRLPNGQLSDLKRTVAAMVKIMPPGYDAPYHILRWYDNVWSR